MKKQANLKRRKGCHKPQIKGGQTALSFNCHLLAVYSWANPSTTLSFSSFICSLKTQDEKMPKV